MSKSSLGREGENRAVAALEAAGMGIIARNVRSKTGEIDIVARDGETIVFVEVKAWSVYGFDALEHSINRKKQRRIIETAKYFLASHREYSNMAVRFDIVFIGPEAITHLASAFMDGVW
ncbi:MAG: YraN family protein [Treponema sp.]|jgi:putative endonuclease|nr:YraN family protein [Treponema sp.]